jgi:hypothetical protein
MAYGAIHDAIHALLQICLHQTKLVRVSEMSRTNDVIVCLDGSHKKPKMTKVIPLVDDLPEDIKMIDVFELLLRSDSDKTNLGTMMLMNVKFKYKMMLLKVMWGGKQILGICVAIWISACR